MLDTKARPQKPEEQVSNQSVVLKLWQVITKTNCTQSRGSKDMTITCVSSKPIASEPIETLRSRLGHFTANDKLRFAVNSFTLRDCPYLALKIRG